MRLVSSLQTTQGVGEMDDEYELEYSTHCGRIERDGRSVQVEIYRGKDQNEEWILEIVDDSSGSSIVWDEQFESDQVAYDYLMKEIDNQGLAKLIDDAPEAQLPR
jgi:hypothetical protein